MATQAMVFLCAAAIGVCSRWLLFYHGKQDRYGITVWFAVVMCGSLWTLTGSIVAAVKGVWFIQSLLYAAVHDAITHEIPDHAHVLVLMAALMPPVHVYLVGLLPAAFVLIVAVLTDGIGGGDVKLIAAYGLVLGIWPSVAATLIGLLLSVFAGLVTRKRREAIALAPFLAAGCACVLFATA